MSERSESRELAEWRKLWWKVMPTLCLDLGPVWFNRERPADFISHADEVAVYPDVEEKVWES